MSIKYCEQNGKVCFETRADAERAARDIAKSKRGKSSVYQCDYCHYFHLTHKPYRIGKTIRQRIKRNRH